MSGLEVTLVYLLAAVLGVVLFRTLHLPPMLGYLAVGVLIGPHALGLTQNSEGVRHLAEFGVVFLMFAIGLEFSLPRLRSMRRHVFGLGLLQVLLTMLLTTAGSYLLELLFPSLWSIHWQAALALSGVMAMSSTAIVVKLMADRLELDSEHGKRILGILLFQDLAVVPLLVLIPALGSPAPQLFEALGYAGLKAVVVLALLLMGGQRLMRRWLTLVARHKNNELFMLNLLLITLGLAWLTERAGLSLALGAFVAGMLIAETEYRHQVEADIRPFHDVLLGLFFITIGMMLDWTLVLERLPLVLMLLVASLLLKLVLVTALTRALGAPMGVSLRTGLYLAQAGEFGFVLLSLAHEHGLIRADMLNAVLASMVLSMLASPFIIMASNRIVLRLVANEWLMQSLQMTNIARQSIGTHGHVLICGFGRCGQNLARMLEAERIPYMALDLDPDRVRQAVAAGNSVAYGDATRLQSLMAAGLGRASAVVITYLELPAAFKVLDHVRQHAPNIPAIVRTQDDHALERLRAAGATEVVPEAIEGSLMLASHALALVGVPMRRVIRIVQDQRDARYNLLRGYFQGADDATGEGLEQERLQGFSLPADAGVVGQSLEEVLGRLGDARVVSVRRANGSNVAPDPRLVLSSGDTLVLAGSAESIAVAEEALSRR